MLGASGGASAEGGVESVFIHLGQRGQLRSQRQERGLESPLRRGGGIGVVGTDVQAVIAAKDPVAQFRSQFLRDLVPRPVKLNGQVGDAPASVHHVGLHYRAGWTCPDAQRAGPTEVGAWFIWLQVERRQ